MIDRIGKTSSGTSGGIGVWILLAGLLFAATQVDAGTDSPHDGALPPELGEVEWMRDFERAETRAQQESKPIFALFQEVPGCQTCVQFGDQVLSHPLLIEAIEDEFIPVAILNNKAGADRATLTRFSEPAWNNPVVRFFDATGDDLIPRRDRVWQASEVADRMIQALRAADRPVPPYLAALRDELAPQSIERATLSMHCYWAGEACLGELPGVLSSRTGDLGGREVVEVRFDSSRLDYATLLQHARRNDCADGVFAHNDQQERIAQTIFDSSTRRAVGRLDDATARNQKYHLKRNRRLSSIEVTPAQESKLNYSAWKRKDPSALLSPRQRDRLASKN